LCRRIRCTYIKSIATLRGEYSQLAGEGDTIGQQFVGCAGEAMQRGWYDARAQGSDGHTSDTYIRGELGDYQNLPFRTAVTVFWEFDASNRLSDIRIWKTTDGF
jgi:hypothetical protein